jgi:hypothetical protein
MTLLTKLQYVSLIIVAVTGCGMTYVLCSSARIEEAVSVLAMMTFTIFFMLEDVDVDEICEHDAAANVEHDTCEKDKR